MANTGRTVSRYTRLWGGTSSAAYDLSGDVTAVGQLGTEFEEDTLNTLSWDVKGTFLGRPTLSIGPVNTLMNADDSTKLIHDRMVAAQGALQTLIAAIGIREAPTYGTPAFCGQFQLKHYTGIEGSVSLIKSSNYVPTTPAGLNYSKAWGAVVHPLGAETGANTGTANVVNNGAATSAGGYLVYVLTSLNAGNVTISIDDSADGTNYLALSGATSGALTAAGAGIVQLSTTATVRQYLRWQLALAGGANTATFATAFVRG